MMNELDELKQLFDDMSYSIRQDLKADPDSINSNIKEMIKKEIHDSVQSFNEENNKYFNKNEKSISQLTKSINKNRIIQRTGTAIIAVLLIVILIILLGT